MQVDCLEQCLMLHYNTLRAGLPRPLWAHYPIQASKEAKSVEPVLPMVWWLILYVPKREASTLLFPWPQFPTLPLGPSFRKPGLKCPALSPNVASQFPVRPGRWGPSTRRCQSSLPGRASWPPSPQDKKGSPSALSLGQ